MAGKATDATAGRLLKEEGSFYTPAPVAEAIVSLSGIRRDATPSSDILDPAAGDGALLLPAMALLVARLRELGTSDGDIADILTRRIHAIELDADEAMTCGKRLSEKAESLLGVAIPADAWDIVVGDACVEWERFRGRMSFVLMNPPYVRIHNLPSKPDSPYVTGMCDLYYAFFDYAQRCLATNGRLAAIAPSSWMTAKAGTAMRDDLRRRGALMAVCDYGHLQVFAPYAMTYTALTLMGTDASDSVSVWGHDGDGRLTECTKVPATLCWHDGFFLPGAPSAMSEMLSVSPGTDGLAVRNGYATNLDRFFMSRDRRFSTYEIPVVKASRGQAMFAIYPYDKDGRLVPFDVIREADLALALAFEKERDALLARTQVNPSAWWCYARTQGITDTWRDKVTVQSLVLPKVPPKTVDAPAGTGVFGGIYVTGMGKAELDEAVSSEEFFSYVMALRKYKSGGYYALGGRDLERFLSWWREKDK